MKCNDICDLFKYINKRKLWIYGWIHSIVKCLWHNVGEYSEVCCKLQCNDVLTKQELWQT